jgi:uncharacterized protein (TIGR03437 family)
VQGIVIQPNPAVVSATLVAGSSTTLTSSVTAAGGSAGTVRVLKESGGAWLSASYAPATGVLPVTVTASADATDLPPGAYIGKIIISCITGPACLPKEITVNLAVVGRANLSVNPTSAPFTADTSAGPQVQAVNVANFGADSTYTSTILNAPWLSVSPSSGVVKQNQAAVVNLTANPAGLDPGTYNGSVRFDAPGSSSTLAVSLSVTGIKLSAPSVSLSVLAGNKVSTTFDITGTEPFNITRATGGPWLTFSPSSGNAPAKITVTADSATLSTGTSQGSLLVNCTTVCASRTIAVQVNVSQLNLVSSADYKSGLAAGTIAAVFAPGIATGTQTGTLPLPTNIANVSIDVKDSAGKTFSAGLFFVSPNQVNFEVPEGAAAGPATLTIHNAAGIFTTANFNIATVAPALYTANAQGNGPPAAYVVYRDASGNDTPVLMASCDSSNNCTPVAIDLSRAPIVYLQLYGTGIRGRSDVSKVTATIAGSVFTAGYAGPQLTFPGLDQVNVVLNSSLAGKGATTLVLTVDGQQTQPVTLSFK